MENGGGGGVSQEEFAHNADVSVNFQGVNTTENMSDLDSLKAAIRADIMGTFDGETASNLQHDGKRRFQNYIMQDL